MCTSADTAPEYGAAPAPTVLGSGNEKAQLRPALWCAIAAVMLQAACGAGYQQVDGRWSYVTIDEGRGKTVYKLDADEKTFTVIQAGKYAKDKDRVFYEAQPIPGADPATFRLFDPFPYAKDKAHVFIMTATIRGADPSTFAIIHTPYGRDAKHIYDGTLPMDVADMTHFEPLLCEPLCNGWSTLFDGQQLGFEFGEAFTKIEASQQNPIVLGAGPGWARDGKYYYCGPARVEGIDYSSFKPTSPFEAKDAHRKYVWTFPESELPERRKRYLH